MRIVAADRDGARLAVTGVQLRRTGAEVVEWLLIRDAIIQNRFWVPPGADAHRPLVQRDTQELLEAFEY